MSRRHAAICDGDEVEAVYATVISTASGKRKQKKHNYGLRTERFCAEAVILR